MNSAPLLSVCVLTYNHGPFVAQAIESILFQKTNFPFEVLVFEDCSTDNTRDVILDYYKQHPHLLKLHFATKNRGGKKNFLEAFQKIKAPYFAFLDGDDYWTDSAKLKMQVEFLQANSEFAACAHNVEMIYEDIDRKSELVCGKNQKEIVKIEDLITGGYMHNSSIVYRNVFESNLPSYFSNYVCGDWFLSIIHALHGPIKYFDKVMSVYRRHSGGCWSGLGDLERQMFQADAVMFYDRVLKGRFRSQFFHVAKLYLKDLLPHLQNGSTNWFVQQKYKTLAKFLEACDQKAITSALCYGAYRLLDNPCLRSHTNIDSPGR